MEIAQSLQLLPGDPRLIDYIVCELKSQGIFDQFRKECIADVDTKPAYQNLRQRVEVTVDGFLSRQKWKPELNKNQLREKLRKHILDSNFLEQGVERIVDQVVNPKIASVFLPQVEEVVYKCLGLEKPDKSTSKDFIHASKPLHVDTDELLPKDLEAVSPDSVKSHEKSLENPNFCTESNDIEMKLTENKGDTEIKIHKNTSSVESFEDTDDSKDEDFESPAFEPIDDLKRDSPHVSHHSASDVNSRDSSDSKSAIKSQESSDSADEKHYTKPTITYDSCEDANMTSPVKVNLESEQVSFKLTNEDNSSDARQCFEHNVKQKQVERMECDDSSNDVHGKSEALLPKESTSSDVGGFIPHHRTSIESKTSSESNKPTPNIDISVDSNDSKGSSIFTPTPKDSCSNKDSFTFANKITSLSDKSMDDSSNSNELKIDLQESAESEDNIKNIGRLSISAGDELKSPTDSIPRSDTKDDAAKRSESSDKRRIEKDSDRRASSSHSRDRKDDSKYHSKSSHSSRHDDRRHSSSHDHRSSSHRSSRDYDRDSKRDKYHKSNNEDRSKDSKDKHSSSSSHRSSSSSHKSSNHKSSSSSSRHDDKYRSDKNSDKYERSSSKTESKDGHRRDERSKDLPHSSRESSRDKSSSRHTEKDKDYSSHDKSKPSSSSKHSSSSDRHRKSSSKGDKKYDDKKSKDKPDKDEQCSSVKTTRVRRSTDRDSNDGNEGVGKPSGSSSASGTAHKSSTKEKSPHQSKGSHSNGNSTSGQSDSLAASDTVKVTAGGYIKSEFNMFQPVVKKPPTTPQLHRSPDNNIPASTAAAATATVAAAAAAAATATANVATVATVKKPVIHIDSQLNPIKEEVKPEAPTTPPSPEKVKKPRIASNIFEARKLMKIRKNMDKMEKKQMQEARKEFEMSKNIGKGESKVYSGSSGPELKIVCRKRSLSDPKSPKSNDVEKENLLYFTEDSKNKAIEALEKSKKHLKNFLAVHNGMSQKIEHCVYLINSDKEVLNAFARQSTKRRIVKPVNIKRKGITKKHKVTPQKVNVPANIEIIFPSSSNCYVELSDLKYDNDYNELVKSKCLPLKKRKMSDSSLIKNKTIQVKTETKPVIRQPVKQQDLIEYDDYEYLDYYSKVDDVLSKASREDIMEIILGGGVTFDSSLVDLNHIKQNSADHTVVTKCSEDKAALNKKRRISFKDSDEIIDPNIVYNNNLREQNESSPAKRSNNDKNGVGDNNHVPIKPMLTNNSWCKARTVGLSREVKPLKGIMRKSLPSKDSPQSPDSDKSVENHPNSDDDSFNQRSSHNFQHSADEFSTALNQVNRQTPARRRLVRSKAIKTVFDQTNIVAPEKV